MNGFASLCAAALATLATGASNAAAPPRGTVAIVGVTVLPMEGQERLTDQTVIVSEDRIVAVGSRSSTPVPKTARVIDGHGQFLMPGLVDMHVHVAPTPGDPGDAAQRSLAVMLANGVTTVRGLAGSPPNIIVRQRIESGELAGPRFYAGSKQLNDSNVHSADEGRAAVQQAKAAGFDLIKSHEISDVAVWQAIEDEAHRLGLPTAGHVNKAIGLSRALAAGQEVEHLDGAIPELLPAGSPERGEDFGQVPPPEVIAAAAKVSDSDLNALARKVAAAHSWQVPTLGLFETISDIASSTERMLADPALKYIPDPVIKQWIDQREQMRAGGPFTPASADAFRQLRRRIVLAYHHAGVPLMIGSDTAQAFHIWGFAAHQEIAALVRAGLTPMEALRSATVVPRDYFRSLPNGGSSLGWKADFGTVTRGARADLILLATDPTLDLRALDRPAAVIAGGRLYDRQALDSLLARAATDAKSQPAPPQPQPVQRTAKQVYILRHLPAGDGADPGLTAAGAAQATLLASQLSNAGIVGIFATPTHRAQETAAPLAAKLGIAVTSYDPRAPETLVSAALAAPGNVLIIGHSNTVPDLIARFGGAAIQPLGERDFGTIYRVNPGSAAVQQFKLGERVAQLGPCAVKGLSAEARCGTILLPENRALKNGRTIPIRFAVIPASAGATDDPLVVLPGGPGLGGVQDGAGIDGLFASMRQHRDLVLIDQRGTGESNPLKCPQGASGSNPLAQFDEEKPGDVLQCRTLLEKKADLRFYFTREAVRDMDAVRSSLGYQRFDLFGMSYGTRVALDYLRLYPDRVGQTVIRSAAPVGMKLPLWGARDTQHSFDRLILACSAQPDCATRYPDLKADLQSMLTRLPAPVRVKNPLNGQMVEGKLNRNGLGQVMFSMLYIPQFYSQLPPLLDRAKDGDFSPLVQAAAPFIFGVSDQIAWGMYRSIVCDEDVRYIDPKEIGPATKGSFMGRGSVDNAVMACRYWPRGPVPADYLKPVASDKPVFIISGEFDPVAGKPWGDLTAQTLSNVVQVEVPGASHLPPLPGCTDRLVSQFLDGMPLAQLDTKCVETAPRPRLKVEVASR